MAPQDYRGMNSLRLSLTSSMPIKPRRCQCSSPQGHYSLYRHLHKEGCRASKAVTGPSPFKPHVTVLQRNPYSAIANEAVSRDITACTDTCTRKGCRASKAVTGPSPFKPHVTVLQRNPYTAIANEAVSRDITAYTDTCTRKGLSPPRQQQNHHLPNTCHCSTNDRGYVFRFPSTDKRN